MVLMSLWVRVEKLNDRGSIWTSFYYILAYGSFSIKITLHFFTYENSLGYVWIDGTERSRMEWNIIGWSGMERNGTSFHSTVWIFMTERNKFFIPLFGNWTERNKL
jgi:hypothetical protein